MFSEDGVPTSVDGVRTDSNQMVVSYTSNNAYVYDIESDKIITTLESKATEGENTLVEDSNHN